MRFRQRRLIRPHIVFPRRIREWRGLPNKGEELDMNSVSLIAFMPSFVVHVEVVRAMSLVWQNLPAV